MESMLAAIDARISAQLAMLESLDEAQDPAALDGPLWQSPERPSAPSTMPHTRNTNCREAGALPQDAASLAGEVPKLSHNGDGGTTATWQNFSPRDEGAPVSTPLLKEMDRIAANYSALQGTSIVHSTGKSFTHHSMAASAMQASSSALDQTMQPSRAGQSLLAFTAVILGEPHQQITMEQQVNVTHVQEQRFDEQQQLQEHEEHPNDFRPSLVALGSISVGSATRAPRQESSILECSSAATDDADHASVDASFGSLLDRLASKSQRGRSGDQKSHGRRQAVSRHSRVRSHAFAHSNHSSASDSDADDRAHRWANLKDTVSATSSSLASLSTTPSYSALRAPKENLRQSTGSSYDVAASASSIGASSKLVRNGSELHLDGDDRSPTNTESDRSTSSGSRAGVSRAEDIHLHRHHRTPTRDGSNVSNTNDRRNHQNRFDFKEVSSTIPTDLPEVTFSGGSVEVIPSHTWRDEGFLGVARSSMQKEEEERTEVISRQTQFDRSLNGSASHEYSSSVARGAAAEDADVSDASSTEAMPNITQRHESSLFMSASASQFGDASDEDSLGSSDDALPSHTRLEASAFMDSRRVGSDGSDGDESDSYRARTPKTLNNPAAAELPRSARKKTSPAAAPAPSVTVPAATAAPIAESSTAAPSPPPLSKPTRGQAVETADDKTWDRTLTVESNPVQWAHTGLEPFGDGRRRNTTRGATVLVTSEGTMTRSASATAWKSSQTQREALAKLRGASAPSTMVAPKEHVVMMRDIAVGPPTPQGPKYSNGDGSRLGEFNTGLGVRNAPTEDEGIFSDDSLGIDNQTRFNRQNRVVVRGNLHTNQRSGSPEITAPPEVDRRSHVTATAAAHSPQTKRTQEDAAWSASEEPDPARGTSRKVNPSPHQPSRVAPRTVASGAAAQGEAWAMAADARRQQESQALKARTTWETRAAECADAAATEARSKRVEQRAREAQDKAAAAFALAEARRRGLVGSLQYNNDNKPGTGSGRGPNCGRDDRNSNMKHTRVTSGKSFTQEYPPPSGGAAPVANYAKAQLFDARPQVQTTRRHLPSQPPAPAPCPEMASRAGMPKVNHPRRNLNHSTEAPLQRRTCASEVNSMRVEPTTWPPGAMLDVPALGAVLGQLCQRVRQKDVIQKDLCNNKLCIGFACFGK